MLEYQGEHLFRENVIMETKNLQCSTKHKLIIVIVIITDKKISHIAEFSVIRF